MKPRAAALALSKDKQEDDGCGESSTARKRALPQHLSPYENKAPAAHDFLRGWTAPAGKIQA